MADSAHSIFKLHMRQELRKRRNALSAAQQAQASASVLQHLQNYPAFIASKRIALYMAADGEINPASIARELWQAGKSCYLPRLQPKQLRKLEFFEYLPSTKLIPNRFGIPEPDDQQAQPIALDLLDIVLLPLVGFDRRGARLGMGGGFYDTTFAFIRSERRTKPLLVGLAHGCQEVESLLMDDWDVPLAAIVTEQELIVIE